MSAGGYLRRVVILYNLFLLLYRAAIAVSALWNEKAAAWQKGRQGQWRLLRGIIPPVVSGQQRFWMHCASLGEFEQGRPVLEALRQRYPGCVIILSFFSPSGYRVRKDYPGADAVCYLPLDGPRSSRRFIDIVQPTQAMFVKYEFWHYYLQALSRRGIPTMLISGAFRKEQPFFQTWGGFFRRILGHFSVLTVQDNRSAALLDGIGLGGKTKITGDTRYDRVVQIAQDAAELPLIAAFRGPAKLVIAGSTWPEDERLLQACLGDLPEDWKLVVAPHEIDPAHLGAIRSLFGDACVFYTSLAPETSARVLIVDNIGMLSALYRYGEIACIGGGFSRSGIHNILEPAVFGLPVIMGPEYKKFPEAVRMVKRGSAFPAPDEAAYRKLLQDLIHDDPGRSSLQALIRTDIQEHAGATAKILALIGNPPPNP